MTPEASSRVLYIPSRQPHATWQSPITGKLLAEAGWGMYQARYRFGMRNDGSHNPAMIQRLEQGAARDWYPGPISRMPRAPGQGGFTHSLIGNLASLRASLTYVTGSHNMKFGYQGGFGNPSQTYQSFTQVVQVRTLNGLPNQLTQTIMGGPDTKYVRNLIPTNFYAQDQWTTGRLTVQGGLRYDSLISNYPDQRIGGPGWPYAPTEIFFPSRSTPGTNGRTSRRASAVAYDLFGNGKTALRFNIGKYLEAITASNNDLDMNPITRMVVNSTRNWTDGRTSITGAPALPEGDPRRGNMVPDCDLNNAAANGECAALDNQNLGRPVFTRNFDPDFVTGWGTRPYNWSMGFGVQHEIAAARLGDRHLQSQLVGQLVRRGQPVDDRRGLHAVQHQRAASIRGCRMAEAIRSTACTTSCRPRSDRWTSSHSPTRTSGSRPRTGRASMSRSWRGCRTGSRCKGARAPGAGSPTAAPCGRAARARLRPDTGLTTTAP